MAPWAAAEPLKNNGKRDDFTVWPDKAMRRKETGCPKRVKSLVNQRFLLSTKLPPSAGPSCGSADQQGGPVETIGKRDVFEGGTGGNRGRPALPKK